jgi:hypothetical protein
MALVLADQSRDLGDTEFKREGHLSNFNKHCPFEVASSRSERRVSNLMTTSRGSPHYADDFSGYAGRW